MAYSYTERKRIRKSFGSRDSVLLATNYGTSPPTNSAPNNTEAGIDHSG